MKPLFPLILDLITSSQGSLIYHLVLAFSIISSLQAAWIGKQTNTHRNIGRLTFGLVMLLLGQIVLFLSSGLAWQELIDERVLIPSLDRAVILFSLVWLVWLWNFPQRAKLGDLVTGFLNLGVIILLVFSLTSWSAQDTSQPFNNTQLDWIWVLASLFVVLLGMALLIFTRPQGWGFGIGMLGLNLIAIAAHLWFISSEGNLSGYIRLGQLASFAMLVTLLYRLSPVAEESARMYAPAAQVEASGAAAPARAQERRRFSSSARTVRAWLEMNGATDGEKVISGMAKGIAHTMLSDLCFIVNGPNYGHIVLQSGYDLIREEEIQGTMLEQSQLPTLSNALQRGKAVRITNMDSQPPDLNTLSTALGLKEAGSMMYIPLMIGEKPHGGILFLSPYSNRQWSADDQNYLSSELEMIATILQRAQVPEARQASERIGETMRAEVESLRQENQRLQIEINQVRQGAPAEQPPQEMDLSALVALQQDAQDQITGLQAENERLQAALRDQGITVLSPEEFERLEAELRSTLQEIALLQNQLAESNARNMMLEREIHQTGGTGEDHEVVISIVQEIRQPMSSILGYTDLLMSETGGILGALQRKFLERIKASTERMHSMLDDLIQVATMGEGTLELLPQSVDLGDIIDGAIADTSAQLREKNIALQVDLPEAVPQINADRDAIQQIILHLLQNAGAVTPPEGTVGLRARVQEDDNEDYLLLQITDTGGGVQPEDLPRVFSRRYRADLPLIEGLGDTGVGLSIAKTLVEAHGGRIWVDSVTGKTTTFSVLLPIHQNVVNTTLE